MPQNQCPGLENKKEKNVSNVYSIKILRRISLKNNFSKLDKYFLRVLDQENVLHVFFVLFHQMKNRRDLS